MGIWRSNNIQLIISNKCLLICQFASLFDGKFDSGRILLMSCEQQDVFTDGNLQHKLELSNWRVN